MNKLVKLISLEKDDAWVSLSDRLEGKVFNQISDNRFKMVSKGDEEFVRGYLFVFLSGAVFEEVVTV